MLWAQNLSSHQWKERVILIYADNLSSKMANQQFDALEKEKAKLLDRKIVIYKCIADSCVYYDWKKSPKRFQITKTKQGFSIMLLGLDGNKKYESNKLEDPAVFFNLIDKMPMRRQKFRNKDND